MKVLFLFLKHEHGTHIVRAWIFFHFEVQFVQLIDCGLPPSRVFGASADSNSISKSSASRIVMWLEETWSSSLTSSFDFERAISFYVQCRNAFRTGRDEALDFVSFTQAIEHWALCLYKWCTWQFLSPTNYGEDRGFALANSFQSLKHRYLRRLFFSHPIEHRGE